MAGKKSYIIEPILDVVSSVLCWTAFFLFSVFHILLAMCGVWNREQFLFRLQRSALFPIRMARKIYLRIQNPCEERFERQAVVICNHQSVFDILTCLSLFPKQTVLMKASYRHHPVFFLVARYAGYHFVDEDPLQLLSDLQADIEAGYSVLVFPEGTRTLTGELGTFQKGAFSLARYFKLDILPLVIRGAYQILPKGRGIFRPGTITLHIKQRFHPNEGIMNQPVRSQAKLFEAFYRECLKERPSVTVIGGGMGGLFTGAILAKEGYEVTVLEKNGIIGGGLQSFRRGEVSFNTGMHNFGGFSEPWLLSRLLSYLGIRDELHVLPVDADAQEIVYTAPGRSYRLPRTREAFEKYLSCIFPDQQEGLHRYLDDLHTIAGCFDYFCLRKPMPHPEFAEFAEMTADELIRRYVTDEELIRVLGYMTPLCGASLKQTNVSVFSMLSVLYLDGEYRFEDSALQLAVALKNAVLRHGGQVIANQEVKRVNVRDGHIQNVETDSRSYSSDYYVAAITPRLLFSMTNGDIVRKVSRHRAETFIPDSSAVSVYIRLREKMFPFINSTVFIPVQEEDEKLPQYILLTTPPCSDTGEWAHTLEILVPAHYADFMPWENTVSMHRDREYEVYKTKIAEQVIDYLSDYYDIRPAMEEMWVATPLTIRDYYHNPDGALFSQQGLYMPVSTRTDNLFLTGQSVLYHGLCGVPITAILTAETISGKDILGQLNNELHHI